VNLGVEEPVRARAHALEAGGTAPARRHGGARQGRVAGRGRGRGEGNVPVTRVAVGRGRRAAFVARALRRAGVLPRKLPRTRFFPVPAGGGYRAARAQKISYYSAALV
jgi:hypothetical protein